jgi:hypothetical protein
MAWVDDLLRYATHPQVLPHLMQWVAPRRTAMGDYAALRDELARLRTSLQETTAAFEAAVGSRTPGPVPTAEAVPTVADVRDTVVRMSASLKEALRFAREDGLDHPEVQQRLRDVQAWGQSLPALERFDLAPERLAQLPPAEQARWRAALPHLRRARQAVVNPVTSVADLEAAAATLGAAAAGFQTATLAAPASAPPAAAAAAPETAGPPPYSRYAPDMERDTGCLPCGNAHIAGMAAVMGKVQDLVRDGTPLTDPQVADRLRFVQEELQALYDYDWTPEKMARSPAADRAILDRFAPTGRDLLDRLKEARTPDAVTALAVDLQAWAQAYQDAVQARTAETPTPAYGVWAPTLPPPPRETVAVDPTRHPWWIHQPTAAEVQALTVPPDVPAAYDRLAAAVQSCGVRIRYRALPATPDYLLEGQFTPQDETILLAPAALAKDSYAVQTLVHETAHALLHDRTCLPQPPADHSRQEQQAEAATVLAMTLANLPIETREGQLIPAGSRQIDWAALEQTWGAADAANLRWAAQWIAQALTQGVVVCETCPVPQTGQTGGGGR